MNMEEVIRAEARKIISPIKHPSMSLASEVWNILLKNEEIRRYVKGLAYGKGYDLLKQIIEEELEEKFKPVDDDHPVVYMMGVDSAKSATVEKENDIDDLLNKEAQKGEILLILEGILKGIDEALDEKDSEKFYRLTNELKELQSMSDELITSL